MNIYLFFTYGTSLYDWEKTGLLSREISIYQEIAKKQGVKFTFVTYGNDKDLTILKDINGIKCFPVYKYMNESKFSVVNFFKSFWIPFILRKHHMHPDLIKTNQLNGSWVAIIAKYLLNSKLIIRTGYDHFLFLKKQKKYVKSLFMYLLTWISLKTCDIYTVTSKADYQFISKNYIFSKRKLLLRPNWVHIPSSMSSNRTSNKILLVGRLESQKNYRYVIQEFANKDIELDIYGEGSQKNDLIAFSKLHNVKCNFKGKLKHNKLIKEYSKYNVYVSASNYEGNPKSTLEAIANGCVVICSDIPNNKEIISDGENGFIFELKKNKLIEKVEKLMSDDKLIKNIRDNSYISLTATNSFEKIYRQDLQDYKDLTKS